MAAELDYVYEPEQVHKLAVRALAVFDTVDTAIKIPEDLRVPTFNAIVNMVATVRQTAVVPQGFVLPPRQQH